MLDTLNNVKARLGITTSDYDAFLTQQIQLVSDVIEAYCRRKFKMATYIQTFYIEDLSGSRRLPLFQYPVKEIISFDRDGLPVDVAEIRVNKPTGYIMYTDKYGVLMGVNTAIKYKAGYDVIPSPILAVLDAIVGERYNKKINGVDLSFGSDVQRISIPGAISIDFDYTLSNNDRTSAYGVILGNNSNILDDWRSERALIGSSTLTYIEEEV